MTEIYRFDWGDTARIARNAPESYHPGTRVAIVGMWTVRNELEARAANCPIGTVLYTVEYDDGSSVELPEKYVEKCR